MDGLPGLLEKMVTNSCWVRARTERGRGARAGEPGEMDASTSALAVGVSYGLQFHYS